MFEMDQVIPDPKNPAFGISPDGQLCRFKVTEAGVVDGKTVANGAYFPVRARK